MLGIFSKTTDSSFIEAIGLSGLDFVIIDQEHGPVQRERLYDHIRAAKAGKIKPIVRVSGNNHNLIGSALDAGALGVQVPNISSAEEAKTAIDAARFYPIGNRGVCRFVSAASYGEKDKAEYFTESNKNLLILQVEGKEGVENLQEILSLKGFDILFIGPYDLSQSLGFPGQISHPKVKKEIMKELGLESFSQEKQDDILVKMGEIILKKIFIETVDRLSAEDRKEFENMLEKGKSTDEVEVFLNNKIDDYDEMVEKIVGELKEEMKNNN